MEKLKILVMTMLPLLAGACRLNGGKETLYPSPPEPIQEVKQDSTVLESLINFAAPYPIESLDLFVYRADGLRDLQLHSRVCADKALLSLSDSLPKTLAVVANVRGTFNLDALNHFDSLEELVFSLSLFLSLWDFQRRLCQSLGLKSLLSALQASLKAKLQALC